MLGGKALETFKQIRSGDLGLLKARIGFGFNFLKAFASLFFDILSYLADVVAQVLRVLLQFRTWCSECFCIHKTFRALLMPFRDLHAQAPVAELIKA